MEDGVLAAAGPRHDDHIDGHDVEEVHEEGWLVLQRVLAEPLALDGEADHRRQHLCQAHLKHHGVHRILHSTQRLMHTDHAAQQ